MSTLSEKQEVSRGVAELQQKPVKGTSLTISSLRRLGRNKAASIGLFIIVIYVLIAIFAPVLAPMRYDDASLRESNATPQWIVDIFPGMKSEEEGGYVEISDEFTLGADKLGRDLLSRIIYGAQVSMIVAFIGPLTSLIIGLLVGLIAGYNGGRIDNLMMRAVDVMYAFPTILFIILLMAFFRVGFEQREPGTFGFVIGELDSAMGGMLFIILGISFTAWMGMARLVRGQVLSVSQSEYVEAAYALGAPSSRIILRHILPNILGPLIIAATLAIPAYISFEAFLSFIGLGVSPPTPSWGGMISEGALVIQTYPHQALFPALALFVLMFAFNFFGDGLRDALDPTLRGYD